MKDQDARNLAERIVSIIGSAPDDLSDIQASIGEIESRLTKLENTKPPTYFAAHPSLDKLNISEAIVDGIFGIQSEEKACTFEPGKPCDHCSMCNSRGF